MLKKSLLISLVIASQVFANEVVEEKREVKNRIDIRIDNRGDGYHRTFSELHTDWGSYMGAANLKTLLEVETHGQLNGSFELWYPISKNFMIAPTIKYTYESEGVDAVKPGVMWAYTGIKNIHIGGRFRKDWGLEQIEGTDETMDLTRTDFFANLFPQNDINLLIKASYFTSQTDVLTKSIGEDWAEATVEVHFEQNKKFSPYIGYTFATDNNPFNNGGQGLMIGFSSQM